MAQPGTDLGHEVLESTALLDLIDRAAEARDGTQRIRTISKAIGMFSRLESSKRSRMDMNAAIQCATTLLLSELQVRARPTLDLGELPAVSAAPGKRAHVFLNLLTNAAESIEEGRSEHNRVRIRTWTAGGDVFAEVEDSGRGIARADLVRVFEPWFSTKQNGVGSGLGLFICRNIVADIGGDIEIHSELGEGTRVRVRLPIQKGVSVVPRAEPAREQPVPPCARGRILVVDADPAIRAMLDQVLGAKHEIVTVDSGEEARALLERNRSFDVVLCDLKMPEMSGVDLHQWLAKEHPPLATQVVFVSGGAFTPRAAQYVLRTGNRRLEKPFELAALERVISDMIMAARA